MLPYIRIIANHKCFNYDDLKMDGHQQAPAWFWISLVLLIVVTIIFYIIVNNDRHNLNTEKQTEFIQSKQIKKLNKML